MELKVGDRLICNIKGERISCTVTDPQTWDGEFKAIWDDDEQPAHSNYDTIIRKETKLDKALK